jgi:hypothetical protein
MGILISFTSGVMFAMNRSPRTGLDARCHPEPEAECMTHSEVQFKRTVRLAAVEIDSHANDRDMRRDKHRQ